MNAASTAAEAAVVPPKMKRNSRNQQTCRMRPAIPERKSSTTPAAGKRAVAFTGDNVTAEGAEGTESRSVRNFDREVDRDVLIAIFGLGYRAGTARSTLLR